jgi:hypothetical protein
LTKGQKTTKKVQSQVSGAGFKSWDQTNHTNEI